MAYFRKSDGSLDPQFSRMMVALLSVRWIFTGQQGSCAWGSRARGGAGVGPKRSQFTESFRFFASVQTRLTRFENIGDRGGIRGVFVSGAAPTWLVARRSRVLALPMRGEARANRAVSFSCFHNLNCRDGFILGTAAGGARICQIPGKMHYEAAWPVRKLALKCTPHHVRYLPDFKLYALSTSTTTKWREPKIDEEDAHFVSLVNTRRAKAMARGGLEEQFAIRLLQPGTLESAWQHTLDPGEHVQTVQSVQLRNTRTGALQSLLAAGTAFPGGEDTPCRGRTLLFDVAWRMRSSSSLIEHLLALTIAALFGARKVQDLGTESLGRSDALVGDQPWLDFLEDRAIRHVVCKHEQPASIDRDGLQLARICVENPDD